MALDSSRSPCIDFISSYFIVYRREGTIPEHQAPHPSFLLSSALLPSLDSNSLSGRRWNKEWREREKKWDLREVWTEWYMKYTRAARSHIMVFGWLGVY
jgi:hypothetical protein